MILWPLAALLLIGAAPAPPHVTVTGGVVTGENAKGSVLFRGIPYAAPPVEALRWQPPRPVVAWHGPRDATHPAPACLQNDQGWNRRDYISGREDCLTLDIATPSLAGRRPVMVWIHGGSNRAGSPGDTITSRIIDKGVVLVAIRYRLGVFGFLSHRGLARSKGGASGNYGLMDQIAALRWIQDNIVRFGGDPGNVTIFGESAGSQDASLLLAAPDARGLFHKAILQSGTPGFGLPFRSREEAFRIGDQLDALLDSGGDIARLRAASPAALLAADLKLHDAALETNDFLWLRPTVDGAVLPATPRTLIAKGPKRPVIIGSNRAEFGLPGGRPHRDALIDRTFEGNAAKARAFYSLDLPDPPADPHMGDRDLQIATDILFRCPAGRMAALIADSGAPAWRYEFDAAPHGGLTAHGLDIPYVFDGLQIVPGVSLQDYWVRFARTGNPNGDAQPDWPQYATAQDRYMAFYRDGVSARSRLRPEICSLMDRL